MVTKPPLKGWALSASEADSDSVSAEAEIQTIMRINIDTRPQSSPSLAETYEQSSPCLTKNPRYGRGHRTRPQRQEGSLVGRMVQTNLRDHLWVFPAFALPQTPRSASF